MDMYIMILETIYFAYLFYGNEDDLIVTRTWNRSIRGRLSPSIVRQLLIAVLVENEITATAGR